MITTTVAKELLHIKGWLETAAEIVARGEKTYLQDVLLQEAGDSLMMKLGEASNRLSNLKVTAPDGIDWSIAVANRNFLIHRYDGTDRHQTWKTLSIDLASWYKSLHKLFETAELALTNKDI